MKAVYPEIISLSYTTIAKSAVQSQSQHNGLQLLIELAVKDSATSTSRMNRIGSSPSAALDSNMLAGKLGSRPGAEGISVAKEGDEDSALAPRGVGGNSASQTGVKGSAMMGAGGSPGGNLHMTAIRAEFERRLEKQASHALLCHAVVCCAVSAESAAHVHYD